MAALKAGPKDAKQYKPRTQYEANALHAESLPLARPGHCPVLPLSSYTPDAPASSILGERRRMSLEAVQQRVDCVPCDLACGRARVGAGPVALGGTAPGLVGA